MGLQEAMNAIAAKSQDRLTYTDIRDTYVYYIRVDFDPVGIRFCADEAEIPKYRINAKAKAKLTYCQYLAMARGGHKAMFMTPNMLLCENAEPVFGFRDLDREKDTKRHMKYLLNEELAWQAPSAKAKLPLGKYRGIYTAPLAMFDDSGVDPDIVFFMVLPYQAYHILNDYMAATGRSSLTFNHTPNSAVCSGSVWAFNHQTANLTTMCAGSKTSGKSDMSMMNLFIPGTQIKASAAQLLKRVTEMGGPSLLGKGGEPWPGLDVCKGCPLFKYETIP
jgi:uncharacterized protein (DUF169 family)|uniref:DUF169 domain-containing protein n=1 Tax=Desulfobacca acetoxidans TaxID=60893 RepID=A0A7C3WRZ4_9BACT